MPPPAAITMTPDLSSAPMTSSSTISCKAGKGTTRR
jgi:hypothetical protein